MFCLHVCLHTMYIHSPWRPKKGISSPKLELQMAVGQHVGAGNNAQIYWTSSPFRSSLSHLCNSFFYFKNITAYNFFLL